MMDDSSRLERIISRISWWITAVRHLHRPNEMYNCPKCQYDGWMSIAEQYPKDSPEAIRAREQAKHAKEL